jgi:hypothetical protein
MWNNNAKNVDKVFERGGSYATKNTISMGPRYLSPDHQPKELEKSFIRWAKLTTHIFTPLIVVIYL